MIYVDKDGNWFHKGAPLVHRGLIGFFYQLLDTDPQGCYIIRLQNQICWLEVEDTPFVPDYEAGKYVLPLNHKTYPISAIRDES